MNMKYSAIIATLFCSVALCADELRSQPPIGGLPAGRILFLGNSITLHGPAPKIGWTGNWGMAASTRQNDYVHLLTAKLARLAGSQPQIMVKNIAAFEREYNNFDIAMQLIPEFEFNADIVIVAIGENVTEPKTDEDKQQFARAFASLLREIRKHGSPTIFVRSSFWPNETKDGIMRKASDDAGVTFVDIRFCP